MLDRFRTLRSKFLIILLIPVVIASVVFTTISASQSFIHLKGDVLSKKESMAALNAELLKPPLWNFDQSHIEHIADSIATDPDVASVIIRNDEGKILTQVGQPEMEMLVRKPITHTGLKREYRLGELEITFHMQRIQGAITTHIVQNSLLLLSLVVVILISAVLANRWIVDRPLGQLLQAITQAEESGLRKPVEWRSRDEIGELITAYNTMQAKLGAEEQKLRLSQAHLADAQRIAQLGSWNLDLISNKLSWSDEIYHIFGLDRKTFDATYEAFIDAIHPEDKEYVDKAYKDSIEGKSRYDIEHRIIRHNDGALRWVHEMCEHHYDDQGNLILSDGTVQDITVRKRMEEMVRQRENQASITSLAAGMAHELNNPVGAMVMSAQNAVRRLSAELPQNIKAAKELGLEIEQLQAYMEKRKVTHLFDAIAEASQRATEIINSLIQLTQKAGQQKEPVYLDDLIENAIAIAELDEELRECCHFSHIEIIRERDPTLPPVACQVDDIERVIFAVLKNAAQAMSQQENPPVIYIHTSLHEDMARIEIKDNGPGMEKQVLQNIFQPFYTTESPQRKGLGLAIAYAIISDAHNGQIHAESEPGKGSRITIELPTNGWQ